VAAQQRVADVAPQQLRADGDPGVAARNIRRIDPDVAPCLTADDRFFARRREVPAVDEQPIARR